jgi:hypothetical protein
MFGRGWEPGQATIVALKEIWTAGHDASVVGGGSKLKSYEFLADVQPAGGAAMFRTVMQEPFDERRWRRPVAGDVVAVKCDPRRQKAKFDTSEASAEHEAQKEAEKRKRTAQAAQFDALVDAPPGAPAPATVAEPGTDVAGASAQDGEDGSASARVLLARTLLQAARRKGDAAEIERLTAKLAQLESAGG